MYQLCQPTVIRQLMEEAGITLKKAYGQNFLINPAIPQDIAEACTEEKGSLILEIGPGIGCLTAELASRYDKVVSVEIDRGLIPVLGKTLADFDNVRIVNEDVMKIDLAALIKEEAEGRPVSVCANLPYYITTPILMRLLESGIPFRTITVMVQAEVADRLTAQPGSGDYGAITAVLGYYGITKKLFTVSAGNFMPPPKVNSAVVQLTLYDTPRFSIRKPEFFFGLIHGAFEQRRKTLVNAIHAKYSYLSKEEIGEAIRSIGFPETVRGERLATEDFARLAEALIDIHS